jgi:hypothetical protein
MTDNVSQAGPKPRPEDVASPTAIIKAMYETISGPAGDRNWYRLRSLYVDGARLIPIGKRVHKEGGFEMLTLEQWIEDAKSYFAETDFWETEIVCKTHEFGNLIQAFSTYEAREDKDGAPVARGINSIQLVRMDGRWWIVSCMWDNESKDNPIPEEFLPYLW